MAKALINKGVPIKADNPKDPYIRDENGIKDIVNSSKTFGKTLGTADGKIQLKNGNKVLSEVSVPAPTPDLSDYGKTLAISGQNLSLKNGNTVLSTVTIPSGGGGGSSAGVSTYYANFSSYVSYLLSSNAVATEIYNKLSNNEDVQIVLVRNDGNKIICRCFGFRTEDEGVSDAAYLFASVMYDLDAGGILIYSFDLISGNRTLAINKLDLSSL